MTVSDYLRRVSEILGCRFELYGKSIAADKVFATDGLLPAFAKKAENLSTFVLNKPLGANYQKIPGGVNGLKVSFDDTVPDSYRILLIVDVLIEIMQQNQRSNGVTRLDELLYE